MMDVPEEKQRMLRQAHMRATYLDSSMTVKPLNIAEYMVTCMNNLKQTLRNARGTGKREERDYDLSVGRPQKGGIEGV
jgi:hypothetical protein